MIMLLGMAGMTVALKGLKDLGTAMSAILLLCH